LKTGTVNGQHAAICSRPDQPVNRTIWGMDAVIKVVFSLATVYVSGNRAHALELYIIVASKVEIARCGQHPSFMAIVLLIKVLPHLPILGISLHPIAKW